MEFITGLCVWLLAGLSVASPPPRLGWSKATLLTDPIAGVGPVRFELECPGPYYLATMVGRCGRTMADNVRGYEAATGVKTAVEPRPMPGVLLARARELPGDLDRVADVLGNPALRLLLTLGNEAAAFVRGFESAEAAQVFLYQPAIDLEFLRRKLRVAHLTHPGSLMRKHSKWHAAHASWCSGTGRSMVAQVLCE